MKIVLLNAISIFLVPKAAAFPAVLPARSHETLLRLQPDGTDQWMLNSGSDYNAEANPPPRPSHLRNLYIDPELARTSSNRPPAPGNKASTGGYLESISERQPPVAPNQRSNREGVQQQQSGEFRVQKATDRAFVEKWKAEVNQQHEFEHGAYGPRGRQSIKSFERAVLEEWKDQVDQQHAFEHGAYGSGPGARAHTPSKPRGDYRSYEKANHDIATGRTIQQSPARSVREEWKDQINQQHAFEHGAYGSGPGARAHTPNSHQGSFRPYEKANHDIDVGPPLQQPPPTAVMDEWKGQLNQQHAFEHGAYGSGPGARAHTPNSQQGSFRSYEKANHDIAAGHPLQQPSTRTVMSEWKEQINQQHDFEHGAYGSGPGARAYDTPNGNKGSFRPYEKANHDIVSGGPMQRPAARPVAEEWKENLNKQHTFEHGAYGPSGSGTRSNTPHQQPKQYHQNAKHYERANPHEWKEEQDQQDAFTHGAYGLAGPNRYGHGIAGSSPTRDINSNGMRPSQ